MRRRSLVDIEEDLCKKLGAAMSSRIGAHVARAIREAQANGVRMAAAVASDYDSMNTHSHVVSQCILGKLGLLKGKPEKNKFADDLDNAIRRLEWKVDGLGATVHFLARAAGHLPRKRSRQG